VEIHCGFLILGMRQLAILLILLVSGSLQAQDTIRTYYDEEKTLIKEIYFRINGKAEGEVKRFDEEGKLVQIGFLKNNQKHGIFLDLNPLNGDTLRLTPYESDERNGRVVSFYPGGAIEQESTYVNNQISGEVNSYYPDGEIKGKTIFSNNKPNGQSIDFHPSGIISVKRNFLDGKIEGLYEEFDEEGKLIAEINYKNGVLEGIETFYYPDGKIKSSRNYSEGLLNGAYELNYEDGKPERIGFYKKGVPDGELLEYHANGKLRSKAVFKKGAPTQPIEKYYEDGTLRQRTKLTSTNTVIHEINYHPNGALYFEANYALGKIQGEVKYFRMDKSLEEIRRYDKGLLHGKREYFDEKGVLINSEIYEEGDLTNK
jgi:antitoxin component YwqK of YwqJK toxin-antitoxin module